MKEPVIVVALWTLVAVHALLVVMFLRKHIDLLPLVILNALMATAVLGYWVRRWYSYFFESIQWHATDQLLPLYALLIVSMSVLWLTGRNIGALWHWLAFAVNAIVILLAALFFTFFRMKKLF